MTMEYGCRTSAEREFCRRWEVRITKENREQHFDRSHGSSQVGVGKQRFNEPAQSTGAAQLRKPTCPNSGQYSPSPLADAEQFPGRAATGRARPWQNTLSWLGGSQGPRASRLRPLHPRQRSRLVLELHTTGLRPVSRRLDHLPGSLRSRIAARHWRSPPRGLLWWPARHRRRPRRW